MTLDPPTARRLFALDHNFPIPIVATLEPFMPEAELVPIGHIDPRLAGMQDDWRILLALHHHARPWEGLITTDSGMLTLPRELSVLHQTRLTLVVAEASGHDPSMATGLVLAHLPHICKFTRRDLAQIWVLRTKSKDFQQPWDHIGRMASRQGKSTKEVFDTNKLSDHEFAQDPLAGSA